MSLVSLPFSSKPPATVFPIWSLEEHLLQTTSRTNTAKWLFTSETAACRSFSDTSSCVSWRFPPPQISQIQPQLWFSLSAARLGGAVPWGDRCSLTARWSPVCCSGARQLWLNSFLEAHSTPSLHNCTGSSFCCWIQGLWEIIAVFTIPVSMF